MAQAGDIRIDRYAARVAEDTERRVKRKAMELGGGTAVGHKDEHTDMERDNGARSSNQPMPPREDENDKAPLMDTDAGAEDPAVDQGAGGQDPLSDMPAPFAPMAPDADLDNTSQE